MHIEETIAKIRIEALARLESSRTATDLDEWRRSFLGRSGQLASVFKEFASLDPVNKREAGRLANDLRQEMEQLLAKRHEKATEDERHAKQESNRLDITLPGRNVRTGIPHPLSIVMNTICDIFVSLGFEIAEGPEIELDWYNFTALNIPPDHPVRDDHDSFYITTDLLLRTETSAVQVHTMQERQPPIRIVAPGRVYRRDQVDATHSHTFHQIEGLAVDTTSTFADLKGTLTHFCRQMFGRTVKTRFRPHYFPFTEPSAEVDVTCIFCSGTGCRVCKGSGWIEVLGSGMVHPRVLENVGYDAASLQGFAFGIGVERIAMLKYGINDIRLFFQNDMRFLDQFRTAI